MRLWKQSSHGSSSPEPVGKLTADSSFWDVNISVKKEDALIIPLPRYVNLFGTPTKTVLMCLLSHHLFICATKLWWKRAPEGGLWRPALDPALYDGLVSLSYCHCGVSRLPPAFIQFRKLLVEAELLVWECQEAGALDKRTGVTLASAAKPGCWNFDWVPDALVEQEVWLEPIVEGRVTWGHVTSREEDSVSCSFLENSVILYSPSYLCTNQTCTQTMNNDVQVHLLITNWSEALGNTIL